MAISILNGFDYGGESYDFTRQGFHTIAEMAAYPDYYLPPLYLALNEETGCLYLFNKDNDVNPTTGKWRKFEGSNSESIQKEVLPTASATEVGNIYQFIGATGAYTKGYFYICSEIIDSETGVTSYAWVNIPVQDGSNYTFNEDDFSVDPTTNEVELNVSQRIWNGTLEEWELLSTEEKGRYEIVHITNDSSAVPSGGGGSVVVVDTIEDGNMNAVTSNAVADAVAEINATIGDINTILEAVL